MGKSYFKFSPYCTTIYFIIIIIGKLSGFESFSWNLYARLRGFAGVDFSPAATICPERIPYRGEPRAPKASRVGQIPLNCPRGRSSEESRGLGGQRQLHGRGSFPRPASGSQPSWVGIGAGKKHTKATERGRRGKGRQDCGRPGRGPADPEFWVPQPPPRSATGGCAPASLPSHPTDTYWKTFSGLSMARGRRPATAHPRRRRGAATDLNLPRSRTRGNGRQQGAWPLASAADGLANCRGRCRETFVPPPSGASLVPPTSPAVLSWIVNSRRAECRLGFEVPRGEGALEFWLSDCGVRARR